MDLKEEDVVNVKLVRVPTLAKMCGYLGSEDYLKYIEKQLASIHETGVQLSRQIFDDKSGRFVLARLKNRFWRGEIIQKLERNVYNVKLPDLGLFVKFHKSRLVNDSNPVRVRDFYPLAFCSQANFEYIIGNDPRKLIDIKRVLNGLIEEGLPALPCQIYKIRDRKFLLKICLYEKTGESFQQRCPFFKLLLENPVPDLQFLLRKFNFSHPVSILMKEEKKKLAVSSNHISIYSNDLNNNNADFFVAPRKTSPLTVAIHNEHQVSKESESSTSRGSNSMEIPKSQRPSNVSPQGFNGYSNNAKVASCSNSPHNDSFKAEILPPPVGFLKLAEMLDLLGLSKLLDVFIEIGVGDEEAFNPENEAEIESFLNPNGISEDDAILIMQYIRNINQGEDRRMQETYPTFRVSASN